VSTPGDLLAVLNDLAKRVAERQLAESDAIANLKHVLRKYPQVRDKWTEERATAELDKRVKRHRDKGNAAANAAIARKLAEMGLESPMLDGTVPSISEDDPSYSNTLLDYGVYLSTNLSSAHRLVKSFESREEAHEMLMEAVGGNVGLTREQAVEVLKRMPEDERRNLRASVRKRLAAERRTAFEQRNGTYGQAGEG
jgi:hypothetical protein